MAMFCRTSFSLLALGFVLSLNLGSSEAAGNNNDMINKVCSATRNPSFCLKTLGSNPPASLADLARISIGLAQSSARATQRLIGSLAEGGKNPRVQAICSSCAESYDDAIDNLNQCLDDLSARDYASMNIHASAAVNGEDTCVQSFKEAKLPVPPSIYQGGQSLDNLSGIILVISNRLRLAR